LKSIRADFSLPRRVESDSFTSEERDCSASTPLLLASFFTKLSSACVYLEDPAFESVSVREVPRLIPFILGKSILRNKKKSLSKEDSRNFTKSGPPFSGISFSPAPQCELVFFFFR